ncbi:hypothetical protein SS50377_24604 [Spironucleus salmonicida]|uniref:Leucine rich repeat-containing protein n=1 Tax=Spironucleus salmonicida TaxID=348837 RepID=A0A9P8LQI9_9EUKA|nr:hypothetical protein SS50377_24604 [Spironucleus salmonicida]
MPNKNFLKIENIVITNSVLQNTRNFNQIIFRNNNFSGSELNFEQEVHFLEISNNLLQNFNFTKISNLQQLIINNNNILSLKQILLPNSLVSLDLSNNNIKSFDLRELNNLQSLKINSTLISNINQLLLPINIEKLEMNNCLLSQLWITHYTPNLRKIVALGQVIEQIVCFQQCTVYLDSLAKVVGICNIEISKQ